MASIPGVASLAFNSVTGTIPVSGPFVAVLVGTGSTFPSVAVRSASSNSQGFHGISRNQSGGVSNALPGQNAMVRASGNVVIPVELLEFELD